MHQNPHLRAPPSTPPQNSHKKSHQGPQRAQISLKSRRKKQIPQIKIQLDDMLGQAFTQIKMQPKKNIRIGNNDIFVLDNQLLRHYVEAVYEEYGIEDPLADVDVSSNASHSKIRSNSNYGRGFQTPVKTQNPNKSVIKQRQQAGNHNNIIVNSDLKKNTASNTHSRLNKTAQRISKLKQNFQSQLQSNPTAVFDNQTRTQKKKLDEISHDSSSHSVHPRDSNSHSYYHNSLHLNPQNQKKTQIKIIRRSSQKAQQSRVKQISHSYLLKKTKHKYCLMCEQQLESDLINSHQKECPQLQQLLNTPNLRIQQIQQILSEKIRKLEREFQFYQNHVHEDTNLLRDIFQKINKGELGDDDEDGGQDGQDVDGGTDLTRAFSMLNTVKCMEGLDKLNWFRKMKAKAEVKKQNGTSY